MKAADREDIAFCGIDCESCPALLATRRDDESALRSVAAAWSEESGVKIEPDDIRCDGCKSHVGRMNRYCAECLIRACASGRGLETCASCEEYPCSRLLEFPPFEREGRANLEGLRNGPTGKEQPDSPAGG